MRVLKGCGAALGAYLVGCVVFTVIIAIVAVAAGLGADAEHNLVRMAMLPLVISSIAIGVRVGRKPSSEPVCDAPPPDHDRTARCRRRSRDLRHCPGPRRTPAWVRDDAGLPGAYAVDTRHGMPRRI
jgi:hypothetical protein